MIVRRTRLVMVLAAIVVGTALSLQGGHVAITQAQGPPVTPSAGSPQTIPGSYIVMFRNNVNARSYTSILEQRFGFTRGHTYNSAIRGFSAIISAQVAAQLRSDPNVLLVEQDSLMHALADPTGIVRIQADKNTIGIASGHNVNAAVAIIDTGVDTSNPYLNVQGGFAQYYAQVPCSGWSCWFGGASYSCAAGTTNFSDQYGHGTHVAGTIAAENNGAGVIGVAPGARIWSVRVLGPDGSGCVSDVIAGVDWVASHASTIDVANMSLGGGDSPALCTAIDNAVSDGIVFVVAAGNSSTDAGSSSPANCANAITVAAVADYNGLPGGGASPTCGNYGADDSLASFSNYGSVVDIAAPGVCILSTVPLCGGGVTICSSTREAYLSGTSMATPHVAGAALLDIVDNGKPTNANGVNQVLSDLINGNGKSLAGSFTQSSACGYTTSNGLTVPLLNVGPACGGGSPPPTPDYSVSCNPGSLSIQAGSNGTTTCTVTSINGYNSQVTLGCSGTANGVGCGYNPTSVTPPANGTANSTLTVTVGSGVSAGSHPFTVTAGSKTFSMALNVTAAPTPDYSVSCNPGSLSIQAGSNGTTTCTVTSINGYNSQVTLGCSGTANGVGCGYNPTSVTPPANGTANSTLTVTVGSGVSAGSHPFTVTAGSKTFSMALNVTAAPTPDYSVSCNPGSLSIQAGSNGTTTCTVTSINGYNSQVTLGCSGTANGVGCGYNPTSVTPPANGTANSTLTVTVGSGVSAGSHPFTVTAGSKTFSMALNVAAAQRCFTFFGRTYCY